MADPTSGHPAYADARHRYRLDTRLATGGMGEVWRATDTVLDRPVAVKQLLATYADDPVFRSRFETEARHAGGLRHPGIAQVYDFGAGDDEHRPFLVMELVDGRPLSEILRPGAPMDPAAAAGILAATADALGAAHAQGIVHRDVKPANLLVTADRAVKVTDFGIARAADGVALTGTGEVLGTPQYISPEQAEGKPVTPASDVYALGAVAFECLAGQRPFQADSPVATAIAHLRQPVPELPSTVPAPLAAVCRRALAKSPADRYADGAELAAALRAASAASTAGTAVAAPTTAPTPAPTAPVEPVEAVDPGRTAVLTPSAAGPHPVGWSTARRIPAPVWAAAGVLVLVVAVAAVASLTGGASPGPGTSSPPASSHSTPSGPASTVSTASHPTPSKSAPGNSGPGNSGPGHSGPGNGNGQGHGHGHGNGNHHGEGDQ